MSGTYSFQMNKGESYSSTPVWDFPSSTYLYSANNANSGLFGNPSSNRLESGNTSDFVISPSGYLKYGAYRMFGLALWSHVNVATTLLRVQYSPNEATRSKMTGIPQYSRLKEEKVEKDGEEEGEEEKEGDEEDDEEVINSSPETMVVIDALGSSTQSKYVMSRKPADLDSDGYLVYSPFMDEKEGTRPPHCLPRLTSSHIWPTVRCIRYHSYEGIFGLYKGLFTDFFKQMAIETIEPSLSSSLCDLFQLDDSLEPVDLDNPLPMTFVYLFSRVFVDWIVSPLEHTKIRLILRSRKAPGFGFFSILRQFLPRSYTHPHFFIPTLSVSLVYHGMALATPLVIDRVFGISSIYNPFQYAMYECLCNVARDLILLPMYTIQLRLCAQPSDEWSIVDQSPIPYTGMWDCFKRILFEERGKNWKVFSPLYKGLRISLWSHIFHFCVRITGEYMDWEAMFEDETF